MSMADNVILKKFMQEVIGAKDTQVSSGNFSMRLVKSKARSPFYDVNYNRNEMFLISDAENGVLRSKDYGMTWEKVFQRNGSVPGSDHRCFWRNKNGYGFVWTNGGNLCRTTVGLTQADVFTGMYHPFSPSNGIDESPTKNLIMYAEYGGAGGTNGKRIWKTTDLGATWTIAHEDPTMGHWHACQCDPYTGYWYACSGDEDNGVKIMQSKDDGVTWKQLAGGNQQYRTCGLQFSEDYIYWVPDEAEAEPGNVKLYRIHKDNIEKSWDTSREEIVDNIEGPAYGMVKTKDGRFAFWTAAEHREMSKIYITDGVKCKSIISTNRYPNTTTLLAGFSGISKPDWNNRVLITTDKCEFNPDSLAFVATLPLGLDLN